MKSLDIEFYENLAEAIDTGIVEKYISDLLMESGDYESGLVIDAIYELVLRQANNREALSIPLSEDIASYIKGHLKVDSFSSVETSISIAINLELEEVYAYLKSILHSIDDREIRNVILDSSEYFSKIRK